MLLRFDPFRELDRVTEQVLPRAGSVLPMDAVRRGHNVVLAFDLPGVDPASIDLTVERDTLTVSAERPALRHEGDEVIASERRFGTYSRRLLLGEALDTGKVEASYDQGVLTITIPTAEQAKPRKVNVGISSQKAEEIEANATEQPAPSAS
jgi:HSP20 family protein